MNILGIIAEFNPLHRGHEYLIGELRQETDADFCVVVMSGDYVQRGEPAFFSKYLRTQAALLSGVDLVLELPLSVSTGSAEYFAQGAVSLLGQLGCVTHLGFGSESGDIHAFHLIGKLLSEEPENYHILLQKYLKDGMNFPKARFQALSVFLQEHGNTMQNDVENIQNILSLLGSPNNILGSEYSKALYQQHASMIPVTLKRIGDGYHEELTGAYSYSYASASGLRKRFLLSPVSEETETLLQNHVPAACHSLYLDALNQRQYITFDDFFLPLYHILLYADTEMLSECQDVTPDFAERLLRLFQKSSSVTELCTLLKTKNLTSSGISRRLLHILLHLSKEAITAEKKQGYSLYARILGFRKEAQPLLSLIKKNSSLPLIAKLADAPRYLSPFALSQLEQTIKASELYHTVLPGSEPASEYTKNIVTF